MMQGKKRIMMLPVVSLLALLAATAFIAADAAGAAGIRVTPDRTDAGTVDEGVMLNTAFTVENTGNVPLTITNVRTN